MDIRILGCFGGMTPGHRTTNFLVNGSTAIDAGALTSGLTFEEQLRVRDVFITHAHLDHTACLPFLIDNVFGMIDEPVNVWSVEPVITSLRRHIFNNETWPDFSVIPDEESSFLRFHIIEPNKPVEIAGVRYTPVPVNHIIPCVGYVIEDDHSAVVFTSDTGPCDAIYQAANRVPNLRALITEVSFPNSLQYIADLSLHLTPRDLARELAKLERDADILLYHLKPPYIEELHKELAELAMPHVRCLDQDGIYSY